MNERNKRIEVRVTDWEKRLLTDHAGCCGLSLSEYLRKRGLGYEPRPLLSDGLYRFYSKLCDLCNQQMTKETETVLLALVAEIRKEWILPQKQTQKELIGYLQNAESEGRREI